MTIAYRAAIACGLLPMLLGTVVFIAWLFTDLDALLSIGIYVVYGGITLFAIGIASLFVFVVWARRRGGLYRKPTAWALAVLFSNFPLCVAYIFIPFEMISSHFVSVTNRAALPIEDLTFTDPIGQQFRIGTIEPNEIRHACPGFSGEGSVMFAFDVGGREYADTLIGYISSLGISATLDLSEDLISKASYEHERRISAADFLRYCVLG